MDLTPSDDQAALRTATADWCRAHLPLESARTRPAGLWRELETMGWIGMTNIGLDHATEALVFAELGRFLAPVALLSSAVAARWAGTGGKVALALGDGGTVRVLDGDGADTAVGLRGGTAVRFQMPGGMATAPSLDPSATLARLDGLPAAEPLDDPRAILHLRLLAAAYAVGCADAARDMASDYAKLREQFGRPIGWFQAIKHICADMAVRAAVARSQLYFAACALDADATDAAFHIAAAKRLADQAALDNGRANIQVHGGVGMTDEASAHLCLKRAHLLQFIAPADAALLLA